MDKEDKEIEVGDYIRLTRNQGINKIIDIDEDGFLILENYIADEWGDECIQISPQDIKNEIIKHSENIFDLIEVNDIIQYRFNSFSKKKVGRVKKYIDARSNKEYLGIEGFDIERIYIEKILTHEQYEQETYKVEGGENAKKEEI